VSFVDYLSDPQVVTDLLRRFSGTRMYDVGANGGKLANLLAPNWKEVHAFEPAIESYTVLSDNHAANVIPHPYAVSDINGEVTLEESRITASMGELKTGDSLPSSWGETTGKRTVRCVTLDTCCAFYGRPELVKVDTEGHELAVIRGGLKMIEAYGPALVIEVHSAANGAAIEELVDYGWRRIDHDGYAPGTYMRDNHYYLIGAP
jgi:FkbM family methyltransferase